MGLVIVRKAVERAGGRLWLESDEGVGTSIHFTLPVYEPPQPGSPERLAPPPPPRSR